MPDTMKVSIVVPVYNVEKYIERCFESIANQSYNNIECIFVDDCSPDNSGKILKKNISQYHGNIDFKIVRHSKNKGLSGARNTGIHTANGEYIYYLDSDDKILPDCIEKLVSVAQKYGNVDLVQGNTQTVPQPKPEQDWRNIRLKIFPQFSDDRCWIKKHFFAKPGIPVNAWNKLIRRLFLYENNLFFREGIIHEDEHWMFFVSKKIKSIAFVIDFTYIHYIVDGSIMKSKSNYNSIKSQLVIVDDMLKNTDDFLVSYQRKKALSLIRKNMFRIDLNKKEGAFFKKYKAVAFSELTNSLKNFRLLNATLLLFFQLPQPLFKSFPVRKCTGILLRLI